MTTSDKKTQVVAQDAALSPALPRLDLHARLRLRAAPPAVAPPRGGRGKPTALLDREILKRAALDSVRKLSPRQVARNPVMFVVEVGSVLTTALFLRDLIAGGADAAPLWFTLSVSLWLWFTVIFANFAEAVAEGRGKAQADSLRKMRTQTTARRIQGMGVIETVSATALRIGRSGGHRGRRADSQ